MRFSATAWPFWKSRAEGGRAIWLSDRPMKGWHSHDARRVASHSAPCYETVTVLSWFVARLIRIVENGS